MRKINRFLLSRIVRAEKLLFLKEVHEYWKRKYLKTTDLIIGEITP
jgi:hypothetical protein